MKTPAENIDEDVERTLAELEMNEDKPSLSPERILELVEVAQKSNIFPLADRDDIAHTLIDAARQARNRGGAKTKAEQLVYAWVIHRIHAERPDLLLKQIAAELPLLTADGVRNLIDLRKRKENAGTFASGGPNEVHFGSEAQRLFERTLAKMPPLQVHL